MLFSCSAQSPPGKPTQLTGKASVIDGDTLEIRGQRVRLYGIDAPEHDQICSIKSHSYQCGQKSALYLDNLLKDKTTRCVKRDWDRYGRMVADCMVDDLNLNAAMVRAGWALAYRQYSTSYVADEDDARKAMRGIWAGSFQSPADYRRNPTPEERAEHRDCLIKGNINSKGERLFHTPGSAGYLKTKIDTSKGERWFCSEKEAVSEGWRPATTPR